MIKKLRTSFLLPVELAETITKYIIAVEQSGLEEPYVLKLLRLLRIDVNYLNKALTSLRVNTKVEEMSEADGVRDDLVIAFRDTVDVGKRRQNPEIVKAHQMVWPIMEKAGLRLYRLGYTEKSGRLAALFAELDLPEFQIYITTLNAKELYEELKAAEDKFLGLYSERIDKDSDSNAIGLAEARRKAVPHVNIFLGVLSTLEEFELEIYDALADKINGITSEIMTVARARKTRNEKEEVNSEDELS